MLFVLRLRAMLSLAINFELIEQLISSTLTRQLAGLGLVTLGAKRANGELTRKLSTVSNAARGISKVTQNSPLILRVELLTVSLVLPHSLSIGEWVADFLDVCLDMARRTAAQSLSRQPRVAQTPIRRLRG